MEQNQRSIIVNELGARGGSNGAYVLLGLADAGEDFVDVRTIIEKRTWKKSDYEILTAIRKVMSR